MSDQQKSISTIWKELRQKYPVMAADKPLAVGIRNTLCLDNQEFTSSQIQAVLGRHTSTTTYLRNVKFGAIRYHLDGHTAGEITDTQRELARLHLNERNQKRVFSNNMLNNPPTNGKKKERREARHQTRLIKIQNKIKSALIKL